MFRVSKRLDYALQFLVALGVSDFSKPHPTAHLSEKLDIPLPFLHQIGHALMQAGLIKAAPGPHGGVKLAVDPNEISVYDVIEALEGPIHLVSENIKERDREPGAVLNPTLFLWNELQVLMIEKLKSIKISTLIVNAKSDQKQISTFD